MRARVRRRSRNRVHACADGLAAAGVTGQARGHGSLRGLGAPATKHWGRIFYKLISPAPKLASSYLHITFVGLEGTVENRVVDTVSDPNGAHQWIYNLPDDSCCD